MSENVVTGGPSVYLPVFFNLSFDSHFWCSSYSSGFAYCKQKIPSDFVCHNIFYSPLQSVFCIYTCSPKQWVSKL